MEREKRRRLAETTQRAMEQLDLPGELLGAPRMELTGAGQFYMEQHHGVLSYSTEAVEISGGALVVRLSGQELQLLAMTENELRIGGKIEKLELIG